MSEQDQSPGSGPVHLDEAAIASRRQPKKSAIAALVGSALEYYDFFIYASASALVFNRLFFDKSDPGMALILSLATFGVAYIARPIGAVVLGRWGDRRGRRDVMVFTLFLMGIATFAIGCLPTYEQIGVTAPALLVVCRLLQGFSAGGEQSSANSMSLEHAPDNRRSFTTGWTMFGTQLGQVMAAGVFIPMAAMGDEFFLSIGWRIPFWLSAIVVLVGWLIRRTLEEAPQFEAQVAAEKGVSMEEVSIRTDRSIKSEKDPMKILLSRYRGPWLRVLILSLHNFETTIFSVWALSYGRDQGIGADIMLLQTTAVQFSALFAIPLWTWLADKIGRKKVYIGGYLMVLVLLYFYMNSLHTTNITGVFVLGFVMQGIFYSAVNGVWPAFYGEQFPTKVRMSGTALSTQIGFALTGFAPTIAAAIMVGQDHFLPVFLLTAAVMAVVLITAATAKETAFKTLTEMDREADQAEVAKYGNVA
ncbi:MAG: MFS transporter [Propioniciclava sp.]|uniref:MFS transporter n=1 Tax=Propioniciclava sp. TaxID=2038686 RepID=UPI0039E2E8C6